MIIFVVTILLLSLGAVGLWLLWKCVRKCNCGSDDEHDLRKTRKYKQRFLTLLEKQDKELQRARGTIRARTRCCRGSTTEAHCPARSSLVRRYSNSNDLSNGALTTLVARRRPEPFFHKLGFHRASPWSETFAVHAAACWRRHTFEVPGKFLFLQVELYGDDVQTTGWAMEHLRRSFAHAWLEYTA